MTNARSQQVGKWAIIIGALVLLGAIALALKSTGNERPTASDQEAAPATGPAQ